MARGTVGASLVLGASIAATIALAAWPQVPQRGLPPPPRQQQPTFRVQVELVQVDVTATDAAGEFVKDLRKEDFELLEDNKPQRVAAFQLVDVPIKGNEAAAFTFGLAPPDVRNNSDDVTGRVYLIVMDDVRTKLEQTSYGRRVAERFIRQYMEPGDTGAVVFTSGRRNVSQEFTSDRRQLLDSINKFMPLVHEDDVMPTGNLGTAASQDSIRSVVNTLTVLAQSLGRVSGGRKACVYIGPGFPVTAAGGAKPIAAGEYRDLTAVANRANVTFYTVDPTGLATLAEAASANQMTVDAVAAKDAQDLSHEGLAWLAVETGGFATGSSNNFDRPFSRIRRDASCYYLLGYYPEAQKEGSTHQITVRVKRPGVSVRSRSSYMVPRASSRPSSTLRAKNVPAALLTALDNPLPGAAVRFAVTAAAFRGESNGSRWISVAVEIDGRDLDLSGQGGADIGVIAIDKTDSVKGHEVRHVDLALDKPSLARVREAGLRVQARVPLEGDIKGLRVAIADALTPRAGSLSIDVDVPEFDKQAASMSGVLLTSTRAAQVPTTNADEEFRKVLGGPASTRREFAAGETIAWLSEVYQKKDAAKDIRVTTTITTEGREAMRREEVFRPSEPRTRRNGTLVVGHTPLAGLAPGAYVLRIEAQVAGERQPVSREIPFRVGS